MLGLLFVPCVVVLPQSHGVLVGMTRSANRSPRLKPVLALIFVFAVAALWVLNSGWLASLSRGEGDDTRLIAHRGVHQAIRPSAKIGNDTCTADLIRPVTHSLIENTIPSMRAAFAAGADVVELDVHLTADGEFAVFHDWTLDCRTDGQGVTHDATMAYLRGLDAGYGYTDDGGVTFPLRGTAVGAIPTLVDVLDALPEGRFLINFKSRRVEEGDALIALLAARPASVRQVMGVYGGAPPTRRVLARRFELSDDLSGNLRGLDSASARSCLIRYLGLGWTGYVPQACRQGLVFVPVNYAWLMWGWPDRFIQRMHAAGSDVVVVGPYRGGGFTTGIDDEALLDDVPYGLDVYLWTNRIEVIGPALAERVPD